MLAMSTAAPAGLSVSTVDELARDFREISDRDSDTGGRMGAGPGGHSRGSLVPGSAECVPVVPG